MLLCVLRSVAIFVTRRVSFSLWRHVTKDSQHESSKRPLSPAPFSARRDVTWPRGASPFSGCNSAPAHHVCCLSLYPPRTPAHGAVIQDAPPPFIYSSFICAMYHAFCRAPSVEPGPIVEWCESLWPGRCTTRCPFYSLYSA